MKRIKQGSVYLFMCLIGSIAYAQQPKFVQAKLEQAVVYFNSAELKHRSSVELPVGITEVVISNVANAVNQSTIQIGANNGVSVMSVQYTNNYIEEYDSKLISPLLKEVKDSITIVKNTLQNIENQKSSLELSLSLLDQNNKVISTNTSTATELEKLFDFYYKKRVEVLNSIDAVVSKKTKLERDLAALEQRLALNGQGEQSSSKGKFIVQLNSAKAQKTDLVINYLTPNAQWKPFYEIKVNQINEPLELVYKADVKQSSGIDWSKVKLSLTSASANQNHSIPVLDTWFIDYYNKEVVNQRVSSSNRMYAASSFASPSNAEYVVEEVYKSSMDEFTTMDQSSLNVSFSVDVPYSIVSNNKSHGVALKEFTMQSKYKYYSAPRVDSNVYLVASIENYAQYNLLPGQANVIFEGVNVGKTFLNPETNQGDLKVNMGKDPRIVITRELLKDKSGTKLFSSRQEQSFLYKIDVRNNKVQAIELEIEDQFPVSKNNDIEVELTQKSNGTIDQQKGKITWDISVKPGVSKQIDFGYLLRYNKDKQIR